jgi:hypothetical protein
MTTIILTSNNYSGQTANITYYPDTGGTISLGSVVVPYYYSTDYFYGTYELYFPIFNKTCTLYIETPIPTPTVTPTLTPTNTITPTRTLTPTLTPTNTITPTPTVTPTPTSSFSAGLYKTTYSGYHNENPAFFATATPTTFGTNPATSVQTTSISESGLSDDGSNFSCQWLGYFKPTTTETYTFFLSSDDGSYLWIGANAQSGFTTANSNVNNGGAHGNQEVSGSISLTAGVLYPIRIQFGEIGGGDVMTFSYSSPTITKTTNVTGLVFYNPSTNGF